MKVFWAWQSNHPREISRDVIRTSLEQAIEHIKETREIEEPPEEARGELHLDHDTKGLTGSPDVADSILKKIAAATVFIGDVTPVGQTPDIPGNEGVKKGRPIMNPNVAIEYGYAMGKLGDGAVLGVLNKAFGENKDLPFDIIHKRWPIHYQLYEGATEAEIDRERARLREQFIVALKGFVNAPQMPAPAFVETPETDSKGRFFYDTQNMGHSNRMDGEVFMPFRDILYMRIIPTKPLTLPVSERAMLAAAQKYGAMGGNTSLPAILNEAGAMSFLPAGTTLKIDALTQYFPNGELWAVNADILRQGDRGEESWYLVVSAEDAFISTLENGLKYMKEVAKAELPLKVVAGVVGLKGKACRCSRYAYKPARAHDDR